VQINLKERLHTGSLATDSQGFRGSAKYRAIKIFKQKYRMKYVLVTGGVVSGLGKGVTASSIGVLMKACGLRVTSIKIDPYLNMDAGTMSPFEHGEVFVLDDGGGEPASWHGCSCSILPFLSSRASHVSLSMGNNETRCMVTMKVHPSKVELSLCFEHQHSELECQALQYNCSIKLFLILYAEADLDLGNYERFLDITLTKDNNITTGKVYSHVIERERCGNFNKG